MVEKYYKLHKQVKELEKELSQLKKTFNQYFDLTVGPNEKGILQFDTFVLQRNIRLSEKFREEEAVQKLEALNLIDCVKVEKRVDEEKVKAAVTLGLLEEEELNNLKERKYSSVISVKEK
ncbi:hypothetical protein GW534_10660 [Bacillus sp. P1(2020)]|uniref:Uncharacterized protein n=2 Tax=Pallidibacillus pasinlerensis TaxID=2703818 RepID=A0ABX0A479_9BACI|nr:hypothetical protein [Pallidibacillus pasinlerensis]